MQTNALAKVLGLPSSARDFKHLLSPSNLQAVFIEPEDCVIPTVPRLHFEGLGNARAKECVQNRLLTCITAAVETCELKQEEDMAVGDDYPISPPPHRDFQERRKRPWEPSSDSPTESHLHAHPSTHGDPSTISRASEVPLVAPRPKGSSHSTSPPHTSLAHDHPKEQRPRRGITIREGYMPVPNQCRAKVKGKLRRGLHPSSLMEDPHLFKEPLLKDPEEEAVFDLDTEFGALMIKKVLDLLRDSTPFQMATTISLYSWSFTLSFFNFLLLNRT